MSQSASAALRASTPVPGLVLRQARGRRLARGAAVGAAALGAVALLNHLLARRAEARHRPDGKFVNVEGVRLHYREAGSGPAIVLVHGNAVASDDFVVSGLMGRLARTGRVIAFDRPGFGHSDRPRGRLWSAREQARLLLLALEALDAGPALIVGHSWGTLVAAEMALAAPQAVSGLVLMSGYYRPTPRIDALLLSGPAIPVLGDVVRYTLSPLLARLCAPAILKTAFRPAAVSARFREAYPISMSLRPSQLRAASAESARLIPDAAALGSRLGGLAVPTLVLTGADDRLLDPAHHSRWLAQRLPGAAFVSLDGVGHMLHHTAPEDVAQAIEGFVAGAAATATAEAERPAELH